MMNRYLLPLAALAVTGLAAPLMAQEVVWGDGFFNIRGDTEVAVENIYGEVKGWEIRTGVTEAGGFTHCAANTSGPAGTWAFGYDAGGQWQLAVMEQQEGQPGLRDSVGFSVDGHSSGITGWTDGLWAVFWLNLGEYEAIAQGDMLQLDLPGVSYKWPLSGTGAAALKVKECVENRGVPGAAPAASPASAPASAPTKGYAWVDYRPDPMAPVRPDLAVGGLMPDGMPIWMCGGIVNGGFHLGQTGIWTETCSVGYGGKEVKLTEFQMLTGNANWMPSDGSIPGNAMTAGFEASGDILYFCRAMKDGQYLMIGKYRPGFSGCNVGDSGLEYTIAPFDILTD